MCWCVIILKKCQKFLKWEQSWLIIVIISEQNNCDYEFNHYDEDERKLFPHQTEFVQVSAFSLLYASPEWVQNVPIKNTGEDAEIRDFVCKQMHMKNNAIISNKQHIKENCLMFQSEMSSKEVVKDCAGFGASLRWPSYRIWSRCSI